MLLTAEITSRPISGDYPEIIYDVPFSTGDWTWVKFEDELYDVLYGQFKGQPRMVAISTMNPFCYVLTDSFLYEISRENPYDFHVHPFDNFFRTIRNITLSPAGRIILSDYYTIFTVESPLYQLELPVDEALVDLNCPFSLAEIEFGRWTDYLLTIHAEPFYEGKVITFMYDAQKNIFLKQKK